MNDAPRVRTRDGSSRGKGSNPRWFEQGEEADASTTSPRFLLNKGGVIHELTEFLRGIPVGGLRAGGVYRGGGLRGDGGDGAGRLHTLVLHAV